ncbi:MAG: regulatory inactivation of DnaA Hda protein [Magnetococcales bacterium]|nr:regulatory inactivation of DnaA Hda protein [Magnetococcales bacterium]HIJ83150.1 ATP-binding protein [Magnetococcales bacterium]
MSLQDQNQLLLPFLTIPHFSFDNFIVRSENRVIFDTMLQFSRGVSKAESMVIVGDSGSGKTHLLLAALSERQKCGDACIYLHTETIIKKFARAKDNNEGLRLLSHYQKYTFVALDAFEIVENNLSIQEYILYFFNLLLSNNGKLLTASRKNPGHMEEIKPELRSRLMWGKVLDLIGPGDEELAKIIQKIALDRNLRLSEDLVHFLVLRLPRSVFEYVRVIEILDKESLKTSRNIAIPLAKELFNL